jgi:predicted GNAT family N-acyltransferase
LIKIVEINSAAELMTAAHALRHEVFVIEQHVPAELEIDQYDKLASHLVAFSGHHVVGTLRIVIDGTAAKIGRLAVSADARKNGIGTKLMEFAAAAVAQRGIKTIVLNAQYAARHFYTKLGYNEEGKVFSDAGIPHICMKKLLVRTPD